MADETLPRQLRPRSPRTRMLGYALGLALCFIAGCAMAGYFVTSSVAVAWARPCARHETSWCLETGKHAVVSAVTPTVKADGVEISLSSPGFSATVEVQPVPYPSPAQGDHVMLTLWNGTVMSIMDRGNAIDSTFAPGWNIGSVAGTIAGLVLEMIALNVFLAVFSQYRIDRKFASSSRMEGRLA